MLQSIPRLPPQLTLGELIGRGTFSEVFKATDPLSGRPCAVKRVFLPD